MNIFLQALITRPLLGVMFFYVPDIASDLHAQTIALQQIATAQQAIAARQDKPPEINGECHEALVLFDERIKKDLRMGLPEGRRK